VGHEGLRNLRAWQQRQAEHARGGGLVQARQEARRSSRPAAEHAAFVLLPFLALPSLWRLPPGFLGLPSCHLMHVLGPGDGSKWQSCTPCLLAAVLSFYPTSFPYHYPPPSSPSSTPLPLLPPAHPASSSFPLAPLFLDASRSSTNTPCDFLESVHGKTPPASRAKFSSQSGLRPSSPS
jgi:hypothetical protein